MKPTISIVIPTYNGAKYIQKAIDSALRQTRPADEIIVSDDNSTDNTIEICKSYGNRIKVFHNADGPSGFVNGWKNAIAHATYDYITILHQDDLLDSTFLEEIEKAILLHPDAKHFFAPCRYIDSNGDILNRDLSYCDGETHHYNGQEYASAYALIHNHIHRCPGVVTHRDIFKVCTYRECAGHIADDDFFLRVGNYTDVVGILKPLASYREHDGSETGHLNILEINYRLLRDSHFQLIHAKENPLLSSEIVRIFSRNEAKFIHNLIVYGLKAKSFSFIALAIRYWLKKCKMERFRNLTYDISSLIKHSKNSN